MLGACALWPLSGYAAASGLPDPGLLVDSAGGPVAPHSVSSSDFDPNAGEGPVLAPAAPAFPTGLLPVIRNSTLASSPAPRQAPTPPPLPVGEIPASPPPPLAAAAPPVAEPLPPLPAPAAQPVVAKRETPPLAAPLPAAAAAPTEVVAKKSPLPVLAEDLGSAPLSPATKSMLLDLPAMPHSKPGHGKAEKPSKIALDRTSGAVKDLGSGAAKADSYESPGISIKVQRQGLDTTTELNKAYNALSAGNSDVAARIYRDILDAEPLNPDALFGLATILHRQGQIDKARPLYATLLQHYPNHRDGLNNFLVLVGDESPQQALVELEKLEKRNPDYAPIPAQQAALLNKLGYVQEARQHMMRAAELAPENLTYKYNLAVILDQQGSYAEAAALYRLLLQASDRGEKLPAKPEALQARLNYIVTAMTESANRTQDAPVQQAQAAQVTQGEAAAPTAPAAAGNAAPPDAAH